MTENDTAKILMAITGVFSSFRPNEMTHPTWHRLLGGLSMSDVISALDSYVASGAEFAPTPGQLLKILERRALPEAEKVTPDEAWAMAISAASVGTLKGLNHERTLNAIQQIGFERLRYADLETALPFVRRDFITAYERSAERDEQQHEALPAAENIRQIINGLANRKMIQ